MVFLVLLFLASCAPVFKGEVYSDGPVYIYLSSDVRAHCMGHTGCAGKSGEDFIILCPYEDMQCIAHEVRHLLQPAWKHP